MQGLIFSVKRYAIHDGPGIRVTFFLKGCPLTCIWCHNPEGISPCSTSVEQVERIGDKEFRRDESVGKLYESGEILEILEKERVFINQSKGGVTFSGGEPMMQFDFLLEVLLKCKEQGFHTSVDTSGFSSQERFRKIFPFTDLFLFDLKHLDNQKHKELTGVSNVKILNNLRLIAGSGKDYILRIPVVPGYNDDIDHLDSLKKFIESQRKDNLKAISLLPYHKIGSSKYKKFRIPYRMRETDPPSAERMKELKEFFAEIGVRVKVGG